MILYLHADTYCELDIFKVGVRNYCEYSTLKPILFTYSIEGEKPQQVAATKAQQVLTELIGNADKIATWLPPLTWYALNKVGVDVMPEAEMVNIPLLCRANAYPGTLNRMGAIIGKRPYRNQRILKHFTAKEGRLDVSREEERELWKMFCNEAKHNLEVIIELHKFITERPDCIYPDPEEVVADWAVNATGIHFDVPLVRAGVKQVEINTAKAKATIKKHIGCTKPVPVKTWCASHKITDADISASATGEGDDRLDNETLAVVQALREASVTSVQKYKTILDRLSPWGFLYDALTIYGTKTGRWTSYGVQIHNFPRPDGYKLEELTELRERARRGEAMTNKELSALLRTAITPDREDQTLLIVDFKNIESRLLAWLAGERWKLDLFRTERDLYQTMANGLHVTRQQAKAVELACGYGGGVKAIESVAPELKGRGATIVRTWRAKNAHIVKTWGVMGRYLVEAVTKETRHIQEINEQSNVTITATGKELRVSLPSGRKMIYHLPKYDEARKVVTYYDFDKMERAILTGEILTANIVSGIARDVLSYCVTELAKSKGLFGVSFHVHDEIILSVEDSALEETESIVGEILAQPAKLPMAAGAPLGWSIKTNKFYY